jgi:hypothetical protein
MWDLTPISCEWSIGRCRRKSLSHTLMPHNMVGLCKNWLLAHGPSVRYQNGPAKHIEAPCSERLHFGGAAMPALRGLKEPSAEMCSLFWSRDPLTTSAQRKSLKNVWTLAIFRLFCLCSPNGQDRRDGTNCKRVEWCSRNIIVTHCSQNRRPVDHKNLDH